MLLFMSDYDALLCPTALSPVWEHGSTYDRLPSFSYTMSSNLTGWPAAVVRGGTTRAVCRLVCRLWRDRGEKTWH